MGSVGRIGAALVAATAFVLMAMCGGSATTPASKCAPGASVACAGPAGCTGYQVCDRAGDSLGACMCAGAPADGSADAPSSSSGSSTSGGSGSSGSSSGSSSGTDSGLDDAAPGDSGTGNPDAGGSCQAGWYEGALGGLYSSHLTLIGENIPMTGTVDLALVPAGSAGTTCVVGGQSENCGNVLAVQSGTFTGSADGLFPFFCTLSGALDCAAKKLVGGWMECIYCIGSISDAGTSCAIGGTADGGITGSGGRFAGPLTADYFSTSTGGDGGAGAIDGGGKGPPAFGTVYPPLGASASDYDPGEWNGAESLAGYPGSGPLPDGGTLGDYLSDAGYGRIGATNDFGGDGWWYATYLHP